MDQQRAQWSPVNRDVNNSAMNSFPKQSRDSYVGSTRTSYSPTTPSTRARKEATDTTQIVAEKGLGANTTPARNDSATRNEETRRLETGDPASANSFVPDEFHFVNRPTTISLEDGTVERRLDNKRHDTGLWDRRAASAMNSETNHGSQERPRKTPLSDREQEQMKRPSSIQTPSGVPQATDMRPPDKKQKLDGQETKDSKTYAPKRNTVDRTSSPRDTPAGYPLKSPHGRLAEPQNTVTKPAQGYTVDEIPMAASSASSASSDDDSIDAQTGASTRRKATEATEMSSTNEPDPTAFRPSFSDDKDIQWLPDARQTFQGSHLPPFVTNNKPGVRRRIELPLAPGQTTATKVEVEFVSWDAVRTFATLEINGQRFIVKAFRGGATPYKSWLGHEKGFASEPVAFASQKPRSRELTGFRQPSRKPPNFPPEGQPLSDDDDDDEYSPASRRKSAPVRRLSRPNYNLNKEDEDVDDEQPDQTEEALESPKSSVEGDLGDKALPDSDQKLINAATKGLRLPKPTPRPKQILRKTVSGTTAKLSSSSIPKRQHSDLDGAAANNDPPKRTKSTTATATTPLSPNADPTSRVLPLYKQANTTLRISLAFTTGSVPIRLRSCPSLPSFFTTVIDASGYTGPPKQVFGVRATFDAKSDSDLDKAIVVRKEWPDSFDVFLETVEKSECWGEGEGGRCGVGVSLVLIEA